MALKINADMLLIARESRDLTQAELAKQSGISQATLSRYESGRSDIEPYDLERIANAVHYPLSFFLSTDISYEGSTATPLYRKKSGIPLRRLRSINAKLNVFRMQTKRLLQSTDVEWEKTIPRYDIGHFEGDAADIARKVREDLQIPSGPILDLTAVIENAGGIVIATEFDTNDIDGACQRVENSSVPPVFFMNANLSGERWRYTLAHELGHAVMHIFPTENADEEADMFAAELLMPKEEIKAQLFDINLAKLAKLKIIWRVSMAALIRRGYDLETLTQRQYHYLYQVLNKQGYRKKEPYSFPPEVPRLLQELVRVHIDELGMGSSEICQVLAIYEDQLRDEYDLGELTQILAEKMYHSGYRRPSLTPQDGRFANLFNTIKE